MRNIGVLAGLLAFQMTLSAQTRHLAAVSEVENEARIVTPDLDVYVERALKVFDSPGLALAIVKDGKTVFAKGYGMRRRGDPARVDENTLFQIGSTTKAFTAAALATLVDQGNFDWDKPVRTYLPWFEMYDPYVSKEITTRDLLSHRSGLGLGEGDLLMFPESDSSRPNSRHTSCLPTTRPELGDPRRADERNPCDY
jgi:CubicO group peptidase (beta-lactamase class C family)